jgi:hypothetical protein
MILALASVGGAQLLRRWRTSLDRLPSRLAKLQ